MKMKFIVFIALVCLVLPFSSCQNGGELKVETTDGESNLAPGVHQIIAGEIIQTSGYTYINAKEGDKENWIAIEGREITEGGKYYYRGAMEMKNFESKELGRTFESVLFIQEFSDQPFSALHDNGSVLADGPVTEDHKGSAVSIEKKLIELDQVEGGITISELFANSSNYSGKVVKIRGEVVKFSPNIMNLNWVHIQDGTDNKGVFDLTVTTTSNVAVGDVVIFEGTITLNKDFGAGYKYDVIMEKSAVVAE